MPGWSHTAPLTAARLARLVWRKRAPESGAPPPSERGWIGGDEAAALLTELTGAVPALGAGLGGAVPWVEIDGLVVACGVPVAVGPREVEGLDGAYRRHGDAVLREAAGREETVLSLEATVADGEPGFDLLWFGHAERYLVRGARLEIEDLFARVVAPVDRGWLERELVRRRRVDRGVLSEIEPADGGVQGSVEVRRADELVGAGWDDPERLIGCRETVGRVRRDGMRLVVTLEGGEEVAGEIVPQPEGWETVFDEGLPWRRLWCRREGDRIVYGAEPVADPRDGGVRTRWAFDLASDLLRLGDG